MPVANMKKGGTIKVLREGRGGKVAAGRSRREGRGGKGAAGVSKPEPAGSWPGRARAWLLVENNNPAALPFPPAARNNQLVYGQSAPCLHQKCPPHEAARPAPTGCATPRSSRTDRQTGTVPARCHAVRAAGSAPGAESLEDLSACAAGGRHTKTALFRRDCGAAQRADAACRLTDIIAARNQHALQFAALLARCGADRPWARPAAAGRPRRRSDRIEIATRSCSAPLYEEGSVVVLEQIQQGRRGGDRQGLHCRNRQRAATDTVMPRGPSWRRCARRATHRPE